MHLDSPHFVKLRWEKLTQQRSSSPICINWYKNADTGSPFQALPLSCRRQPPSPPCVFLPCVHLLLLWLPWGKELHISTLSLPCATLRWLCICWMPHVISLNHLAALWLNAFQLEPTTYFSLPAGHSQFSGLPPAVRHLGTLLWEIALQSLRSFSGLTFFKKTQTFHRYLWIQKHGRQTSSSRVPKLLSSSQQFYVYIK